MKNENLVPKVRFKGFSDPWEQRKLKNIAIRVRGNDGRMELPTLTISATQGWLNQKDRFSENIAGKEQKNYTLLKKGQLSYNHGNSKTAKYGAVFKLDIYTEALVPRVYHSFTVKHNNSADFIEYLFATGSPNRELRKLVSSGARMDGLLNISFDAFFNINLQVPIATEQMKIAKFFRKTDNLIAANEDKLEQLKTLKKLMMQKIFSQEWRFKGFTDPWEQRKLCQIATINPKSVISPHFLYVDLESVSQNRVTQYKAVTKDDAPSRAQRLAKKGDIFFQNVRPYQKNNLLFLTNKNNVVFSTGYTQIRTKQDIRYLFYALQTTPFVNRILALSTGTSYPAISSSKLANASLLVPIIDEQSKVGLSIFKIDSLIAANKDKLNQLKKLKKYLMQNMFV
ncbi:restriction endonuclease subunit S [Lactiplantibacillus plantarum]|uniref:restriction endonuclease subunit S n=3 Tax=Lactiplantibacillus plantarum TaxID=1590 RepID=UPI00032A497D|nr:restriction endonuclease subunit S [Lactiplantibacillus plantarum]AGL63482.2 Type IC HsdS subunit [Lactiplantibacillus plantarum subsp. plantarum P-8]AQY71620.1 restriction endonuclease subunit S [Lactiplantibacillus plantarum]KZT92002.1 Type I restriction-modification system specificity subunit S [Lactiplantibacillus plantarum]KZU01413.1 Type I restriction-modification system specificity subunit S [Lactiplantibacillus plantarum]MBR7567247.1 restriction endonuclease subunit S [Lactiplantiba